MKRYIVYLVVNRETGLKYIGVTTQRLDLRWSHHKWIAKNRRGKNRLHADMFLLGEQKFSISILEECDGKDALFEAEKRWVSALRTRHPDGYNLTAGGSGISGMGHSAETREKIGRAHRGMKRPAASVELTAMKKRGKKISPKASAAISRPVVADGIEYPSLQHAVRALHVVGSTISRRIELGWPGYETIIPRKKRRPRTPEQVLAMRHSRGARVLADGVEYRSLASAAQALSVTRPAISYRISVGMPGYNRIQEERSDVLSSD